MYNKYLTFLNITLYQLFLYPFHFANVKHFGKKWTILIFRNKFAPKKSLASKTGQMNITIEFSIFELVYALSSSFGFLHHICLERKSPVEKKKKLISPSNSAQHTRISLNPKFHLKQF